jgi:hypothetical protein
MRACDAGMHACDAGMRACDAGMRACDAGMRAGQFGKLGHGGLWDETMPRQVHCMCVCIHDRQTDWWIRDTLG